VALHGANQLLFALKEAQSCKPIQTGRILQATSIKQHILTATVQNTEHRDDDSEDDALVHKAMSEFLENERDMWMNVKATQFMLYEPSPMQ
jgi:hypothetical protein